MDDKLSSLEPIEGADRRLRRRLTLKAEIALVILPTITVLLVLAFVEVFSRQRLLFASLASSAFLIYIDPQHGTNRVRTLVLSQMGAACFGSAAFLFFGPGYVSAASAILVTIAVMIVLDAVHPPAVSTALSFAFRASSENNLMLFGFAVAMVAVLVALQRFSIWLVTRYALPSDAARPRTPPRIS